MRLEWLYLIQEGNAVGNSELLQILLGVSLSANSFFGTYFLAGIKSQIKQLRRESQETQKEQVKQNERQNLFDYKIISMQADLNDLPCKHKKPDCMEYT